MVEREDCGSGRSVVPRGRIQPEPLLVLMRSQRGDKVDTRHIRSIVVDDKRWKISLGWSVQGGTASSLFCYYMYRGTRCSMSSNPGHWKGGSRVPRRVRVNDSTEVFLV